MCSNDVVFLLSKELILHTQKPHLVHLFACTKSSTLNIHHLLASSLCATGDAPPGPRHGPVSIPPPPPTPAISVFLRSAPSVSQPNSFALLVLVLLLGGVFGSPHIATGQSTVTFDDQGFSDQEIVSSPLSISAGGKAIVFEDVNTTISDFQYRTSEGGTLNYDQRGELVIRTQSGEEIDASTIELTLSSSGQSTSDATITGYRDGYQVAQLTGVSFGNSSDPQEKSLSGFTAVDRIVIKVNSYNGPPSDLGRSSNSMTSPFRSETIRPPLKTAGRSRFPKTH